MAQDLRERRLVGQGTVTEPDEDLRRRWEQASARIDAFLANPAGAVSRAHRRAKQPELELGPLPRVIAPPEPTPADRSWDVRCRTCDWQYAEEDGASPFDEADIIPDEREARLHARNHQCPRDLWIKAPGSDEWLELNII